MQTTRRSLLLATSAWVLSACGGGGSGSSGEDNPSVAPRTFARQGFNMPDWSVWSTAALDRSLQVASDANANTLIFSFTLYQSDGLTGANFLPIDSAELSRHRAAWARAVNAGFVVWIKPGIYIGTDLGHPDVLKWWAIESADPDTWFRNYGDRVAELCTAGRSAGAAAVLDGNELLGMTRPPANAPRWNALHDRLRSTLGGAVGCNVVTFQPGGVAQVDEAPPSYFDRLDFVGLSAYPTLSQKLDATRADYVAGWSRDAFGNDAIGHIAALIARLRKPVCFTELGAPATRGGNWFWHSAPAGYVLGQDGFDVVQQAAWYDATWEVLRQRLGRGLYGIVAYCLQANLGDTRNNYEPVSTPEALVIGYAWNLHEKPALNSIRAGWSVAL
jgi:hypothetical protein